MTILKFKGENKELIKNLNEAVYVFNTIEYIQFTLFQEELLSAGFDGFLYDLGVQIFANGDCVLHAIHQTGVEPVEMVEGDIFSETSFLHALGYTFKF